MLDEENIEVPWVLRASFPRKFEAARLANSDAASLLRPSSFTSIGFPLVVPLFENDNPPK